MFRLGSNINMKKKKTPRTEIPNKAEVILSLKLSRLYYWSASFDLVVLSKDVEAGSLATNQGFWFWKYNFFLHFILDF